MILKINTPTMFCCYNYPKGDLMLTKIISKWKIMTIGQKITGILLLILFAYALLTPVLRQIESRNQIKNRYIETCVLLLGSTIENRTENSKDEACSCIWKKALKKYGYETLGTKMRFGGYTDAAETTEWTLECVEF
jgi:hypothetical protein